MAKSVYNDRYLLPDPLCKGGGCRTTRYRNEKRKREEELIAASVDPISMDEEVALDEDMIYDTDLPEDFSILCESTAELEMEESAGLEDELADMVSESEAVADQPLYEGSVLSQAASNILIMQYKMKHNITLAALSDLLKLIKLHCPSPNSCVDSTYLFRKIFSDLKYPIVHQHFCSRCCAVLDSNPFCPNADCLQDVSKDSNRSSFIQVSIEHQLQALMRSKLYITLT